MKKIILNTFLFLLITITVCGQDINKKILSNSTNEEILIGLCNREGFTKGAYATWFNQEYDYYRYLMDRSSLDSLKPACDYLRIIVVLGTWCSDSREQFPRFACMLDYLKFNEKDLLIYCVDRNKKTMKDEIDSLDIEKVPTIIFFINNLEIGRIIETPMLTLEKDMLNILRPYIIITKPKYND